jgi:dienelactone hydrolase
MSERAITFGATSALVGILTQPEGAARRGVPAVLMSNVGINHRVGPYRIQVDLARALAQKGVTSLRFDVSGMGDSETRKGVPEGSDVGLADLREAMAFLEKKAGATSFLPVGFCSSVDAAHALALADERVRGVCYIEGYAYRTRGFWKRYPLRFTERARWARILAARFPKRFPPPGGGTVSSGAGAPHSVFVRDVPTRERFATDVGTLARRDVRLLFLYSGGDTSFNHLGQFDELMAGQDLRGKVEVDYYPKADHTFFRTADRERVIERVCRWVEGFPTA